MHDVQSYTDTSKFYNALLFSYWVAMGLLDGCNDSLGVCYCVARLFWLVARSEFHLESIEIVDIYYVCIIKVCMVVQFLQLKHALVNPNYDI